MPSHDIRMWEIQSKVLPNNAGLHSAILPPLLLPTEQNKIQAQD